MKNLLIRLPRLWSLVLVGLFLTVTQEVMACPVCYGASDSPMADGVNAAIFLLLGITGTVLSAFVAFFLYIRKRAKLTLNGSIDYPRPN